MNHPTPSRSREFSSPRQLLPWRSLLCVLGCLSVSLWTCDLVAKDNSQSKQVAANTTSQKNDDLDDNSSPIDDDAMDAQVDEASPSNAGKRRPGKAQRQQNQQSSNEQANNRRVKRAGNALEIQEEEMPEALAVLHDYRPELVKRFQDWAERHPENARKMLSRSVPMMTRLIRMRRDDPAGYRLAIEDLRAYRFTVALSKLLKEAQKDKDQARIDDLTEKLRTLLTHHFEVRQKIREREIQKLQDRIDQLRTQMDRRVEKREQILNLRFKQLSEDDK